ncbi:hypothetical protein [Pseudomonas solani]|uniref:hypothetical protein n=1 Tax=Pseudomonas solani TaxID=2731552 RepID=UPI003D6A0E94
MDIAIRGPEAVELLRLALDLGFTRIGISQKGAARFHPPRDVRRRPLPPPPVLWSY